MFKGLGVHLSYATKVLIANYIWIYPLLFGGAGPSLTPRRFWSAELAGDFKLVECFSQLTAASAGLVIIVLYLPLLNLIRKLS